MILSPCGSEEVTQLRGYTCGWACAQSFLAGNSALQGVAPQLSKGASRECSAADIASI